MDGRLAEIFENEWYLVRYSGETPEIALHAAMYYLTRAKDGPRMVLGQEQFELLRQAAVDRFTEIIVRDLQHANAGLVTYRGPNRSIINYRRFCIFCERQQVNPDEVRRQAAAVLCTFLATELAEVSGGTRPTIINCSFQQLRQFAENLGVKLQDHFLQLADFCPCPE